MSSSINPLLNGGAMKKITRRKITQLTAEQIALMPDWGEQWLRIGLCTDPADFDTAERAVLGCYASAGLARPKVILRMGSPMSATVGGAYAALLLRQVSEQSDWEAHEQVKRQLDWRVGADVDEQVGRPVGRQVELGVREQVDAQVDGQV